MYEYHHADEIIRPHKSAAGIWVGDLNSAENLDWLRQALMHTYHLVITAAEGFSLKYPSDIKHIKYLLQDKKTQNIGKVLEDAADKIQKSTISLILDLSKGGVLVHCGAGVSRSSTLVIGYLLKYCKMDFLTALKYIKSKRPGICPNLGFELQLKSFQKLLRNRKLFKSLNPKTIELPGIKKSQIALRRNPLLMTQQNASSKMMPIEKLVKLRRENSIVSTGGRSNSKSAKHDKQYLKKMAMFRFGVTTEKWRLG